MRDEMPFDGDLTPDLRELVGAMRGLAPAPTAISRDRLLFDAGAAAGLRSANRWRGAAAALVLGNGVLLAVTLPSTFSGPAHPPLAEAPGFNEPVPPSTRAAAPARGSTVDRAPLASADWAPPATPNRWSRASGDATYVSVRDALLNDGLAGLPQSPAHRSRQSPEPLDVDTLLDREPTPSAAASPWSPLSLPFRKLIYGEHL